MHDVWWGFGDWVDKLGIAVLRVSETSVAGGTRNEIIRSVHAV